MKYATYAPDIFSTAGKTLLLTLINPHDPDEKWRRNTSLWMCSFDVSGSVF